MAEPVGTADLGISLMLLGSISFMMATFYLVNHRDAEMRRYSWRVISSTISIFSAVLLFQACNGVVEHYAMEGMSLWHQFLVDIAQMICWFALLQLTLGYFAGALGGAPESLEAMHMNMKTFAVLLGHITGFSAINAWATLQQVMYYRAGLEAGASVLHVFLVLPLAYVSMRVLYVLTEGVRMQVATYNNEIDEFELMWMQETEETENDVTGLAISFLTVQVLRFVIGGWLPNPEGFEPTGTMHTTRQVLTLVAAAGVFALCKIALKPVRGFKRTHELLTLVFAMGCAWCGFYSMSWIVSTFFRNHGAVVSVILALMSTFISFSMIFTLERIEARYKGRTPETVEKAIHAVIESLGILVGFSWEHSFDVAITCTAEEVDLLPRAITKLFLAVALFTLVAPAWRAYILPQVMKLDEEARDEEEQEVERFYARWAKAPLKVTEHLVQAPLALLPHCQDVQRATNKELKQHAKERLQILEKSMKIQALQETHKNLAEQSMELAHELAHLGHMDVLESSRQVGRDAERVAELESTVRRMNEVDEEQEHQKSSLRTQILELESAAKQERDHAAEAAEASRQHARELEAVAQIHAERAVKFEASARAHASRAAQLEDHLKGVAADKGRLEAELAAVRQGTTALRAQLAAASGNSPQRVADSATSPTFAGAAANAMQGTAVSPALASSSPFAVKGAPNPRSLFAAAAVNTVAVANGAGWTSPPSPRSPAATTRAHANLSLGSLARPAGLPAGLPAGPPTAVTAAPPPALADAPQPVGGSPVWSLVQAMRGSPVKNMMQATRSELHAAEPARAPTAAESSGHRPHATWPAGVLHAAQSSLETPLLG